jgi:hypothetical protein
MADITLAEFNGNAWLVGGEAYLDDLLANTLSQDISIELVACERKSDVMDLWVQHCGKPDFIGDPWIIHPGIVARIRRRSPDYPVFFTQWSAMLDSDALTVIASAVAWAHDNQAAPVVLAEYLDPAGPKAVADLSRLRTQLIEDRLTEGGLDPARIVRETRPLAEAQATGQESQRVDIIIRVE